MLAWQSLLGFVLGPSNNSTIQYDLVSCAALGKTLRVGQNSRSQQSAWNQNNGWSSNPNRCRQGAANPGCRPRRFHGPWLPNGFHGYDRCSGLHVETDIVPPLRQ